MNKLPLADAQLDRGHRGYILALLTCIYVFNYLDRSILGLLMQPIKDDLHLSDTQLGLVTGIAFAFFYSTLAIPIAKWADTGNRVWIITITTALWSLMVVFCGAVTSYLQLVAARIGVAIGEAGCVPPAQSLISELYEVEDRPRALSVYLSAPAISSVVGFSLAGVVNEVWGWRAAFVAVGILGLMLSVVALTTLKEPRLDARLSSLTQTYSSVSVSTSIRHLWLIPAYRHTLIGFTLLTMFVSGAGQWLPTLLMRHFSVATSELGFWYALDWGIGGIVGVWAGGFLATRFAAKKQNLQLTAISVVLLAYAPAFCSLYLVMNKHIVFLLMFIAGVSYSALIVPIYGTMLAVAPSRQRAMAVAVASFSANLIGMGFGPLLIGLSSDVISGYLGTQSLKYGLLFWTLVLVWFAALHFSLASRSIDTSCIAGRVEKYVA